MKLLIEKISRFEGWQKIIGTCSVISTLAIVKGHTLFCNNQIAQVALSFDLMQKTRTTTINTNSVTPAFHVRIGRADPSRSLYCYIHKYFLA